MEGLPSGAITKPGHGDGALLVGEVERELGRYRAVVGCWRYTSRFKNLLAAARTSQTVQRSGDGGVYLMMERRIASARNHQQSGAKALATLTNT